MLDLWKTLKPDRHVLWATARAAQLGCASLETAAELARQALGRDGELPATVRTNEVAVREQLCPRPQAAVTVRRGTAWCRKANKICKHLLEAKDDWVKCALVGKSRKAAYWWDVGSGGGGTTPKQDEGGMLSKMVKMLGPALLGGLVGLYAKERKLNTLKQRGKPIDERYSLVSAILKSQGVAFGYNKGTRTFEMPKAKVKLTKDGALMTGPGVTMRTKNKKLTDDLFKFIAGLNEAK